VIFFLIIRRNKNQSYDRYYGSTDSYSNSLLISNDSSSDSNIYLGEGGEFGGAGASSGWDDSDSSDSSDGGDYSGDGGDGGGNGGGGD
jgi:hypothetical protein